MRLDHLLSMENMRNWNKISRNSQRNKTDDEEQSSSLQLLFDFQGPLEKEKREKIREKRKGRKAKGFSTESINSSLFTLHYYLIRGCSSVGRAPALQAGGQGFESLHLHHRLKNRKVVQRNEQPTRCIPVIVQITRAHSSEG